MDKYAIYLRKSRADLEAEKLGEAETLARHKKILTDLAARKGYYIEHIYQEIVSGETIEARPEIQKLINDCYAGKYKGILIVEVTRLSRGNQGDAQTILDCLKYSNRNDGLLVITPTKVYDVAHSAEDEEYMEFELFMSRREYKMIKKRMERGRVQAVVEGNYMGTHRPYGFDIVKTKTSRTLKANPVESEVVKNMFHWFVEENMTPGKIARRLDAMGVLTYSGDREWSLETIRELLANPIYIGKLRWNCRMKIKTMVNGKLVTSRPRANNTDHYMVFDGKHKGFIDEELFNRANERFHSDRTKANFSLKNPLASILICGKCKRVMAYQGYATRSNARPRIVHRGSTRCKVKSALLEDVVKAVVHGLKMYIEDFEVKVDNLPNISENSLDGQLQTLQKELTKTEKIISSLFDAWEGKMISDNEFVQRKAVNNERIEVIKKQINELEATIPEKEEYEEKLLKLSDALEALLDEDLDADIKNEYLKRIIDKIEFSRENDEEFILDIDLR